MKQNHITGTIVDGKLRTINEFSENDRDLKFLCPQCTEPLILKLFKTRNQSHFSHKADSNCTGAQESAYHLMAKEVLNETKSLKFPEVSYEDGNEIHFIKKLDGKNRFNFLYGWVNNELEKIIKQYDSPEFKDYHFSSKIRDIILPIQPTAIKSKLIQFDSIEIEDEYNLEVDKKQKSLFYKKYGFIPDAVGIIKNKFDIEKEVIIEFYYSHKVDIEKLSKIKEQNLACIEIDISKLELDKKVFKDFFESKICKSIFLNNPKATEIKTNFLKTIEEKVIDEVDKIQALIQAKENEINGLKELSYIEIPSSLNLGFKMEEFCYRNAEKKQEYRKSKFYYETIVKDVIDNGWNLMRDYDRSYRSENIIGMTLYKKDNQRRTEKNLSKNLKEFFSDYNSKMWTTHGCKDCKFYKKVDFKKEYCGANRE